MEFIYAFITLLTIGTLPHLLMLQQSKQKTRTVLVSATIWVRGILFGGPSFTVLEICNLEFTYVAEFPWKINEFVCQVSVSETQIKVDLILGFQELIITFIMLIQAAHLRDEWRRP